MIIDRLYESVAEKGVVCVGLDTDMSYVPDFIKENYNSISDIIFEYNKLVIENTKAHSAVYKLQIAYYERLGIEGLKAYSETLKYLKSLGIISIADVKRGDIAATGDIYAKAHFEGDFEADFITVNPYMGFDTLEPYMPYINSGKKGIFALLVTSNKGADDIEGLKTDIGFVYEHVGEHLKTLAQKSIGDCGYSNIGMVVGIGSEVYGSKNIRQAYPSNFFLIPGYGAQGAKPGDIKQNLKNGNGGVVNSSRGILKAPLGKPYNEKNFGEYFTQAVLKMKEDFSN